MKQNLVTFTLVAAIVLSACGGSSEEPTATPVPASPTAPPPTATVPPPTATPISPTPAPAPVPAPASRADEQLLLTEAISKTREAKNYAASIVFKGQGDVMDLPTDIATSEGEVVLMELTSQFDGDNSSTKFGGLLSKMLGAEGSVEYLLLDGKTYIKGPAALLGALEAKWYVVPAERADTIKPPLETNEMLADMAPNGDDMKSFQAPVTEQIDGQACQVFKATEEELTKNQDSFSEAFSELETAEARLAVCADGYVHELSIQFAGKLKKDPTKTGSISVVMRLTDFGKRFSFEAPTDPEPLGEPGGLLPVESTPEAQPDNTNESTAKADYPKPDDAKNVITAGEGVMILETGLSLKDAMDFYRNELSAQGLTEKTALTVETDSVFSLVMAGLPDGKAVVVQGVKLAEGKTTITVRTEAQ